MINIIGIYDCCGINYDETTISKTGLGGSETWVVRISEALARIPNTHIIVYCGCNPHTHEIYKNIEYAPIEYFHTNNMKYDALIISRVIPKQVIEQITLSNSCNNVYFMTHDVNLRYFDFESKIITELYYDHIYNNQNFLEKFKGIFVLSNWHKEYIKNFNFPINYIILTANGIDDNLLTLESKNNERDNNIFWSNCIERGFDVLVEKIAPKILKKYPDFKVYISGYNDYNKEYYDNYRKLLDYDYVINLGNLNKTELYNEMIKHKCAFYPCTFSETFCITSMEQAICENDVIMPLRYGPATIFNPYKYMFLDLSCDFDKKTDIQLTTNKIINSFKTYYDNDKVNLRKSIKEYLINKYNWDVIAVNLFKNMNLKF